MLTTLAALGAELPVDQIEGLASVQCVSASVGVLHMGADMGPQAWWLQTPTSTAFAPPGSSLSRTPLVPARRSAQHADAWTWQEHVGLRP